jgi:putative transposase
MTVTPSIDPARLLEEHLAQASPDLLRELLGTFVNTLLSADADVVCAAEYGQVSPSRVNRRNGYRHRDFDTRAGTIDVAIPKLRQAPTSRSGCWSAADGWNGALTSVVATCYLLGVSTRRMASWSPRSASPRCRSRRSGG